MKRSCLAGLVALMWIGAGARAAPILTIDVDPTTPGIQDTRVVAVDARFEVDILIAGVEATDPLNGFELDLAFAPPVVGAAAIADGGFPLDPVLRVESSLEPASVGLAALTVAATGASGSGVLARISFDALAPGTSPLELRDVILSAPFGRNVPVGGVESAEVVVGAVPEPRAMLLFAVGSLVVAWRGRLAVFSSARGARGPRGARPEARLGRGSEVT